MRHFPQFLSASFVGCALVVASCGLDSEERTEPDEDADAGERTDKTLSTAGEALEDIGNEALEGIKKTGETVKSAVDEELEKINALGLTARNLLNEEVRTPHGDIASKAAHQ